MKRKTDTSKRPLPIKKFFFNLLLALALAGITVFILNIPRKIQDDYLNAPPEFSQTLISIKDETQANSISEINSYLSSFNRTESHQNVVNADEKIKRDIVSKVQKSLDKLLENCDDIDGSYLQILKLLSSKLNSFANGFDDGETSIYLYIITTDCYNSYGNLTTLIFYNVDITARIGQDFEEQYSFYLSDNMDSLFSLNYTNSITNGNIISAYSETLGQYSYSEDGNYAFINHDFDFYLNYSMERYENYEGDIMEPETAGYF